MMMIGGGWMQWTRAVTGAAVGALRNPTRQDLVAAVGELTASPRVLDHLRHRMLQSAEGRRILRQRPHIHSQTLPLARLRTLPAGTLGREYVRFLDVEQVSPDTREPIRHLDPKGAASSSVDLLSERAYVMLRYRQIHDFVHVVTGMPTTLSAELALKWFEFAQTGLPMTLLSGLVGPVRLGNAWKFQDLPRESGEQAEAVDLDVFFRDYVPWAIQSGARAKPLLAVFWEERFDMQIDQLCQELGILPWSPSR